MIKAFTVKLSFSLLLLAAIAAAPACLPASRPAITANFYMLDYEPSMPANTLAATGQSIRVEKFSSAQEYNTQNMIFSPEAGVRQNYNYSRWRIYPAEMMTDYLARDLRAGGMFKAVTTGGLSRFRLEGSVDEFLRLDTLAHGQFLVRLTLSCTLVDTEAADLADRFIFQHTYNAEVAVDDDSPLGMARGMSQAARRLSAQIQQEVVIAINNYINNEQ